MDSHCNLIATDPAPLSPHHPRCACLRFMIWAWNLEPWLQACCSATSYCYFFLRSNMGAFCLMASKADRQCGLPRREYRINLRPLLRYAPTAPHSSSPHPGLGQCFLLPCLGGVAPSCPHPERSKRGAWSLSYMSFMVN